MQVIFCYIVFIYFFNYTNQTPNTPQILFKKLAPVQIYENLKIGHEIINLKEKITGLHEINHDKNNQIFFEFQEDKKYASNILNQISLNEYFILDEYSGIIRTSKSIDLEHFCNYNLCQNKNINNEIYLNKTQQEGCRLSFKIKANKRIDNRAISVYHISFDLIIHDINEFYPIFYQKNPLTFNVNEEFSPIELLIGSVPNDNDCTDRSQTYYKIKIIEANHTRSHNQFMNDNTSFDFHVFTKQDLLFLYSNKPLDREIYQSITLDLIAYDRVNINEANTAFLRIIINILDINDNAPIFKIPVYSLEFDEGLAPGTELIQVEATDLDQAQNGQITFELASITNQVRKNFILNRTSGVLYLKNKLTSEIKNWTLQIKAVDHGSNQKSSFCLVYIKVKDINNHKPEIDVNFFVIPGLIEPKFETIHNFDQNSIQKENVVFLPKSLDANTTIGIVSIYDPDSGLNGQIGECKIYGQSEDKEAIFLQNFNDIDSESEIYSSNDDISEAIKMLVEAELNSYKKIKNEQKFLIRTRFNFNGFKKYNIELKASDLGLLNRQTGSKSFKIVILNTQILSNQYLDEDEFDQDFVFNQEESADYDEDLSIFSRLGLRINLNENNFYPISLVKLVPKNFGLNTALRYEIFLPTTTNSKSNLVNYKKSSILQCSVSLYKYLTIEESGIIKLNRSLDREICQFYKFFIRGESINDKRISSVITFKINVLDLNDNPPRFENKKFKFDFITGLNKTITIPIKDPDLEPKYIFRIESIDHREKISDIIKLQPAENFKSIDLILNEKMIDNGTKKKFLFNLIVIEANNFNSEMVNSDITLVEINILNKEELKPEVKMLSVMGDLADNEYSSITIVNDKIFYVNTSYDRLIEKLRIKESTTSKTYLNLLKIKVKEKNFQNSGKIEDILFFIQNIRFYDTVENLKNKTEFSFPTSIEPTELFLLAKSNGILNVDLNSFKNLNSQIITPFVCFIEIKVQNVTNQLCSNFTIILSVNRKDVIGNQVLELEAYLKKLYSIETNWGNFISKIDNSFLKNQLKSFGNVLINKNTPLLILTIIIIFLLIILIVLFIISIIYLLTFCKLFDCDRSNLKSDIRVNDCQSSLMEKTKENEHKTHGWLSFKISKILQRENKSKFTCPNICLASKETGINSKFIQTNEQKEYLLDSPILVRKIYENIDNNTKDEYLKKYHLEYLFDSPQQIKSEKKTKKISFKNIQKKKTYEKNCYDDSSSFEDDDLIIPQQNKKSANIKIKQNCEKYLNSEIINKNIHNQFVSKNNHNDVVWIKKNYQDEFLNFKPPNHKEIIL